MTELTDLLTPAERQQMSRRAFAFLHLAYATRRQCTDPCQTSGRFLSLMTGIARYHGLTEDEIQATITETREECAS